MSKMETGNFEITPEPFAPAPAIASCCDLLALKAQRGRRRAQDAHRRRSAGDRRRPARVQPDPDQPHFQCHQVHAARRPRHASARCATARKLAVTVEDTGVGIGEADLPRLGEAFFQARASYDRRHDGTGLGLSIVKGLVRLHGGDMDIRSRLGEGTRVTVRLPIDCEGAPPAGRTDQTGHRAGPRTRRGRANPGEEKCVAAADAIR